jgi:hypothetical protein
LPSIGKASSIRRREIRAPVGMISPAGPSSTRGTTAPGHGQRAGTLCWNIVLKHCDNTVRYPAR